MSAARALALAGALAGCGGDAPEGLPVGQAPPPEAFARDPFAAPPGTAARRAGDPDSLGARALRPDSLPADSLRTHAGLDSLRAEPPSAPAAADAAPDLDAAWRAFLGGRDLATTPAARRAAARALAPPFGPAVRAAQPRTFRRDGTLRTAVVRVGFDAGGAVVPQDEAVRDSTVRLVFDVVDGAYRLVDATLSE